MAVRRRHVTQPLAAAPTGVETYGRSPDGPEPVRPDGSVFVVPGVFADLALVVELYADACGTRGRSWPRSCFRCVVGGEVRGSFSQASRRQFDEMIDEFRRSAGLKGL
jgi:hypothetical protein